MSLARKITFLFFLLLALIVFCVYTNIKPYLDEQQGILAPSEQLVEEPKQDESKSVEEITKEETPDIVEQNSTQLEEKAPLAKVDTEVPSEEPQEEVQENVTGQAAVKSVLRRIDNSDYKRTNGELMYIDLSLEAQQVQDALYAIMRDHPFKFQNGTQRVAKGNEKTFELIANIIKDYPKYMFEVAGHAFVSDDEKFNTSLSVLRAANIKKILKSKYGLKNRFKARGYGDLIPLVQDDMKLTDRIEFNIIGE